MLFCLIPVNAIFIKSFQRHGLVHSHSDKTSILNSFDADPSKRLTIDSAAKHPWVVREGGPLLLESCRCKRPSGLHDNPLDAKDDVDHIR